MVVPLKAAVKSLVGTPAGWRLARAMVKTPGAIVLMYHRVGAPAEPFRSLDVALFRSQMLWLRRNCRLISPEELEPSVLGPDRFRPPVLVTFDDGYRGYHDHAYPVLKELGIPALVFLSTSFIDQGGLLWVDALRWAASRTRRKRMAGPAGVDGDLDLSDDRGRKAYVAAWASHLKRIPEADKAAALKGLLARLADGAPDGVPPRQMMTWTEVRATRDLTRFGGHSHTHPVLSRVNADRLEEEVRTCRDRIETETGVRPRFFAYPNGQPDDFTPAVKAALGRHGFEVAFTAIEGVNGRSTDWMEVRRFSGRGAAPQLAWLRSARG